jgi:hypothetical protein
MSKTRALFCRPGPCSAIPLIAAISRLLHAIVKGSLELPVKPAGKEYSLGRDRCCSRG